MIRGFTFSSLRSSAVRSAMDKGELFVVAYTPLSLILACIAYPEKWNPTGAKWFIAWTGVSVLGVYFMVAIVRSAKSMAGAQQAFSAIEDQGGEVTAYLATYLLPLLGAQPHGVNEYVAYAVYFGVLFVVFMRSDRVALVNPTLYLVGYRVFTARRSQSGERVLLLARHAPADNVRVGTVQVAGCYVITRQPIVGGTRDGGTSME